MGRPSGLMRACDAPGQRRGESGSNIDVAEDSESPGAGAGGADADSANVLRRRRRGQQI